MPNQIAPSQGSILSLVLFVSFLFFFLSHPININVIILKIFFRSFGAQLLANAQAAAAADNSKVNFMPLSFILLWIITCFGESVTKITFERDFCFCINLVFILLDLHWNMCLWHFQLQTKHGCLIICYQVMTGFYFGIVETSMC